MNSFYDFCEPLDHELKGVPALSEGKGVKIDGDGKQGVRNFCKAQKSKAVDYVLCLTDKKYEFVEFSDLALQVNAIINDCEMLRYLPDRKLKKRLKKKQEATVGSEVAAKYKDTCQLFVIAPKYLDDVPELSKGAFLWVVYADIEGHRGEKCEHAINFCENKIEIARLIDHAQNTIHTSIADDLFHGVKLIPLSVFQKKLQKYASCSSGLENKPTNS